MVRSVKDPAEEKSAGGIRLYQEYQRNESEKAASAAKSSAIHYSTKTSTTARAKEKAISKQRLDTISKRENRLDMGAAPSNINLDSHHTTNQSGAVPKSGTTVLYMQMAQDEDYQTEPAVQTGDGIHRLVQLPPSLELFIKRKKRSIQLEWSHY